MVDNPSPIPSLTEARIEASQDFAATLGKPLLELQRGQDGLLLRGSGPGELAGQVLGFLPGSGFDSPKNALLYRLHVCTSAPEKWAGLFEVFGSGARLRRFATRRW